MTIRPGIAYVGVNDHDLDLFEAQYAVPHGMSYNSYVITDEKVAVLDSVEARFGGVWLENIARVLGSRQPDYLIVQHMEPDHSANIRLFLERYPQAAVVASAKALAMMKGFYGDCGEGRSLTVKDGDTLPLGGRTLRFIAAPMVHWPEVMMTYDEKEGVVFSADAFGKFGALDCPEPWEDEARRYYFGIVGKYGAQVQGVLRKLSALTVTAIAPLHGPVLTDNLPRALELYGIWSSYAPENDGVTIAYASVYGHTREAADLLAERLSAQGLSVRLFDLARCDWAEAVAQAFASRRLVLAATTYNADVFPCMRAFIGHLTSRGYKGRTVALMENGSWAPQAAKVMQTLLEGSKDITLLTPAVRILSALSNESRAQLEQLAQAIANS
ncbi:MAG: FprA family A-type flavoprotein [Clostridiales bacterium]|nr:FprA family A-type flavoprotein [Clostridiales bacterium]